VIDTIAHRDYDRRGAPIMVAIFDDRVEIKNPGGLLPGLKFKSLEGKHSTRNETICRIFHETMDMERFGTGIGKMKNLMKAHGLKEPTLTEEGDFFAVTFLGPGDKILDLVPSIPEERTTDLKKLGLNKRQIEALRLMVNEKMVLTNEQYQNMHKVARRTALRDLQGLVESGQARATGVRKGTKYSA
ncbi:MAG: ATP-binding protein, partial [Candidatus Omnitrophota bacterium]